MPRSLPRTSPSDPDLPEGVRSAVLPTGGVRTDVLERLGSLLDERAARHGGLEEVLESLGGGSDERPAADYVLNGGLDRSGDRPAPTFFEDIRPGRDGEGVRPPVFEGGLLGDIDLQPRLDQTAFALRSPVWDWFLEG